MVAFAENRLSPAGAADAGDRRVRKTITNGGLTGIIPDGTTDYPGAAAHTGMGQSGFRGVEEAWLASIAGAAPLNPGAAARTGIGRSGFRAAEDTGFPGPRPNPLNFCCNPGWQCMEERNLFGCSGSTDSPTKQYIWGVYIDECIQTKLLAVAGPQNLPAGACYLLQDLLYRAMALTNSSGNVVEAYDSDAYGNTLIFTAPGADGLWFTDDDVQSSYGANEVIYCGYRFDAETQLYYVRHRTYNPVLGRWIQRDPIGYKGGINLYGYVAGQPVGTADTSGMKQVKVPGLYYFKAYNTANPNGDFVHAFLEINGNYYGFFPLAGSATEGADCEDVFWFGPGVVHLNDSYSNLPVGYKNARKLHSILFLRKYSIYVDDCAVNPKKAAKAIAALAAADKASPPRYNYMFNNCGEWATSVISEGVWEAVYPGPHPHLYIQYRRVVR